jgi:uncharacterized protein (DUF2062 family)
VRLESGVRVSDSQCGLRIYPLNATAKLKSRARRYGFETEILTRFGWANLPVIETPVRCIYDVSGGRTTHFRPWHDSVAAVLMHLRLIGRSLWPWPVKKLADNNVCPTRQSGTIAERFGRWMNPLRVWRQIRSSHVERRRFARSLGVGVFVATLPPFGFKTVTCLLLARWLRLEPVVVIGASSLNTPPIGTVLSIASIIVGHVVLHGEWPDARFYDPSQHGVWRALKNIGLEWIVGSVTLGALLAALSYGFARVLLQAWPATTPAASPAHTSPHQH